MRDTAACGMQQRIGFNGCAGLVGLLPSERTSCASAVKRCRLLSCTARTWVHVCTAQAAGQQRARRRCEWPEHGTPGPASNPGGRRREWAGRQRGSSAASPAPAPHCATCDSVDRRNPSMRVSSSRVAGLSLASMGSLCGQERARVGFNAGLLCSSSNSRNDSSSRSSPARLLSFVPQQ